MSFTLARVWNSSSEESSPPVSVSTSFKVWNSSRSVLVMERTLCNVWNWSSDSESESTVLSVTERRGREKSDLAKETDSGESVETQEEKQVSDKDFQKRLIQGMVLRLKRRSRYQPNIFKVPSFHRHSESTHISKGD